MVLLRHQLETVVVHLVVVVLIGMGAARVLRVLREQVGKLVIAAMVFSALVFRVANIEALEGRRSHCEFLHGLRLGLRLDHLVLCELHLK